MATLVRWPINDPQNVLDTFGAGALSRIDRSSDYVASNPSAATWTTDLTTVAVVATTTEYEYRDQTGVPGTDWYRIRFSKATPGVAADYSGYGPVFPAGVSGGEVLTLEVVKTYLGITDTDDDPWLPLTLGGINGRLVDLVGVDLGPSPDTTRTYDAADAVRGGTRLWVPGGIRAFTAVEVSSDGSTWTAVTSDVRIGPSAQSRPPGEPGAYVEFKPYTSGSAGTFWGYNYVRITGTAFETFGWDAYPAKYVLRGLVAAQRAMADRQGRGNFPTETDMARYIPDDDPICAYYRDMYFPRVR